MHATASLTKLQFAPLAEPKSWPPCEVFCPPPTKLERRLWRFPSFIGWVMAWIISIVRYHYYEREVLNPMAKEIVDQLKSRQGEQSWPETSRQRKIVEIVAEAVSLEKGIELPLLHPKDRYGFLFWGPFDDLTPLIVRMELQKVFGLKLTNEEMFRFWKEDWTLKLFVDYCDWKISKTASAA